MSTLGEILGGILKDITQSRAAADAVTRDYMELYARDPLLAQLPVPRMTIRDVTVTLRFAVDQQRATSPVEPPEATLNKVWVSSLTSRVVPGLITANVGRGRSLAGADAVAAAVGKAVSRASLDLSGAVRGQPDKAVGSSVDTIMAEIEKLPAAQRKLLPASAELKLIVEREVREQLTTDLPVLKQAAVAKAAALSDLDILVRQADLAQASPSSIQEITLSLALDDVRLSVDGTTPATEA
ncbi:MAG: hypothetical protein ABIZ91_14875 [Gemmatimonadaceae bacterium]